MADRTKTEPLFHLPTMTFCASGQIHIYSPAALRTERRKTASSCVLLTFYSSGTFRSNSASLSVHKHDSRLRFRVLIGQHVPTLKGYINTSGSGVRLRSPGSLYTQQPEIILKIRERIRGRKSSNRFN